jgi:capsular exopolysaccharide synthesis family protein
MELRQYLRVLRAYWRFVVATVVVCAGIALVLAFATTVTYTARTQLFVAAAGSTADPAAAATYQGSLFSQERVLSYAQMVSSPAVVTAVIEKLRLPETERALAGKITATVPTGTVLLNIDVDDSSATRAAVIARAVAEQFSAFVTRLETPAGSTKSRVNVEVTSPAQVPTSASSPRKSVYLAIGLVLGVALGVGGAFARDALDRRVRTEDDAALAAGAPVLGSVSGSAEVSAPLVMTHPFSARADEYQRLRANLARFVDGGNSGTILVSSPDPGDGKTTVAANLAVAFAQAGHQVVVVDANLRRPRLERLFGRVSPVGLSDVLLGKLPVDSALVPWSLGFPLSILGSGPERPNPSELIASPRFLDVIHDLTERFAVVIVDGPALLEAADALVMAQAVSGSLVVARSGALRADHLAGAVESLRAADARLLGIVLNRRARGARFAGPRRPPSGGAGKVETPGGEPLSVG